MNNPESDINQKAMTTEIASPNRRELTPVELLQQEHAIYKAFFDGYMDRPMNDARMGQPFVHPLDRVEQLAFKVCLNMRRLRNGIKYYDPAWADADKVLLPLNGAGSGKGD